MTEKYSPFLLEIADTTQRMKKTFGPNGVELAGGALNYTKNKFDIMLGEYEDGIEFSAKTNNFARLWHSVDTELLLQETRYKLSSLDKYFKIVTFIDCAHDQMLVITQNDCSDVLPLHPHVTERYRDWYNTQLRPGFAPEFIHPYQFK